MPKTSSRSPNRYSLLIENIFRRHYTPTTDEFEFAREEIEELAAELGIALPKNLGDIIYSFRYRSGLPDSIRATAPDGKEWVIRSVGRGRYVFTLANVRQVIPSPVLVETKIPDATPGIITRYALNDEQALLAVLRYNRLIDVFLGIACYSLQNHLRTTVPGIGQVETDEIYVGLDTRGAQYVVPVQAKGAREHIGMVQLEQDVALCADKFAGLICVPVAAQFMEHKRIALFAFEQTSEGISLCLERHYVLVQPDELSEEELAAYRSRPAR